MPLQSFHSHPLPHPLTYILPALSPRNNKDDSFFIATRLIQLCIFHMNFAVKVMAGIPKGRNCAKRNKEEEEEITKLNTRVSTSVGRATADILEITTIFL